MYESDFFKEQMKWVMAIDPDQVRDQCQRQAAEEGDRSAMYPYVSGRMTANFELARSLLKQVVDRCRKAEERVRCLQWAIETRDIHKHIADLGDAMLIYDVADMVEKSGLSDEKLRDIMFDGLTEDQIEQKRLDAVEQV